MKSKEQRKAKKSNEKQRKAKKSNEKQRKAKKLREAKQSQQTTYLNSLHVFFRLLIVLQFPLAKSGSGSTTSGSGGGFLCCFLCHHHCIIRLLLLRLGFFVCEVLQRFFEVFDSTHHVVRGFCCLFLVKYI
jgi:hypothetical protein